MDHAAVMQSKMSKVEASLRELNNEILIATEYLLNLKGNSAALVRTLDSITTPATYLEQFLVVNSFLLKSVSFLSEFNCKFELLQITEKALSNLTVVNKSSPAVAKVEIVDEPEEYFNNEPVVELKSSNTREVFRRDIIQKQPTAIVSDDQKGEEENNSMSCQNKITKKNTKITVTEDSTSENKSKNAKASVKNDNRNSLAVETKQNSDIQLKSENLDDRNKSEDEVLADKIKTNESDGERKSNSGKNLQSSSNNCEKTTVEGTCISLNADELSESPSTKNLCTLTQLLGNIPVAEVVPTKIIGKNLDGCEDFKNSQDSEDYHKGSQVLMEKDDELEEVKSTEIERTVGKEYKVVIEYIKSPSEFYVSITDEGTNLLAELERKLLEIPANKSVVCNTRNEFTKTMLSREIGTYCLVYSKCDEIWMRAKVTNWCLNYKDDFISVFLLDYGESKCVSIYDLQAMPKYLKQYPAGAVRCHLHDVFPVDMDKNNCTLSWEKESSNEMKSLTEDSANIRIKVAPKDSFHPDTSLPVTLWVVDQGIECINELLVRSKCAIHGSAFQETEKTTEIVDDSTNEIVNDFNEENSVLNNWNPMKEDYESYKNSYDLDVSDPSAIIYGYVGKDYDRICRQYMKTGYCYKGQACRKEHQKLDHLGFTTDQEEVYQSAINNLQVPPPKSKVNIQVTYLLACNKFFCFMENKISSSQEENLHSLVQFMNKKENVLEMKKLLIPPSAGQIVIAQYSVDKSWYRARVLESQPENDQFTVFFVDYGNSETLQTSHIRAIEARYLHLPFQAIQCCIFGIEKNPEVPLDEVINYMNQRISDGHLSIEVVSRLPGDNINLLVNVFDQNGISIGKDLISKKYAIFKEEMIINSASEVIPG